MDGARGGAVGGHLSFKPPPPPSTETEARTSIQSMRLSRTQAMDAYSRHKQFVNDYMRFYGRKDAQSAQVPGRVTDDDLMRKEHRFLRTAEDDAELTYEKRLAKKYYEKLFKEYAIADLRLYKEGKVGLRWRTEQELIDGKGQFVCGARGCDTAAHLTSFEVHFAYVEAGEKKAALVKIRLCPPCGEKLHYRRNKDKRREEKKAAKRQREEDAPPAGEVDANKRAAVLEPAEGVQNAQKDETPQAAVENEANEQRVKEMEKEKAEAREALAAKEAAVWQQKPVTEKTKEEEFDDYFRDLFP